MRGCSQQRLRRFAKPHCTPSALNTASTGSAKKPVWNLANNSPGMVGMSLTLAIGNRIRLAPASKATGEVAHERSFQVDFRLHTPAGILSAPEPHLKFESSSPTRSEEHTSELQSLRHL